MHNFLPKQYYFIDQFDKKNIDKLKINTGIIYRNYTKKLDKKLILELKFYCKKRKLKFFISNNFIVIGSAHNIKEIRIKELQKTNLIFISSIFKKNKNYLGINKFSNMKKTTKTKVVALGGVSKKNIKKLGLINCFGFAGISYFK